MTGFEPLKDEELNLIEVVETVWLEKTIILIFLLASMGLGFTVFSLTPQKYETALTYSVDLVPHYQSEQNVQKRVKQLFYDPAVFAEWKTASPNAALEFTAISGTLKIQDLNFQRPKSSRLIELKDSSLLIRSRNTLIIAESIDYLTYICRVVSSEVFNEAIAERDRIEKQLENTVFAFNTNDSYAHQRAIERFLSALGDRKIMFTVEEPFEPVQTSRSRKATLVLSAFFGIVAAVLFILIRKAFSTRTGQPLDLGTDK